MSRKARICMSRDRSMGGVMMSRQGSRHGHWGKWLITIWVLMVKLLRNAMKILSRMIVWSNKVQRRWIGRQGSRHGHWGKWLLMVKVLRNVLSRMIVWSNKVQSRLELLGTTG